MAGVFQKVVDLLTSILNVLLSFLPDSPFDFSAVPSEFRQVVGYVNYFIPIRSMLNVLYLWLSAITIYYVYSAVLRWVKAIE